MAPLLTNVMITIEFDAGTKWIISQCACLVTISTQKERKEWKGGSRRRSLRMT